MARNSLKNIFRLIDQAQNDVPIEQQFLSDLERSIEIQDKKNSRAPSQTYKPSSMNCIRNMYFQVIGAEQDDTESQYTMVGICNSGSDIHQRIQQAVLDMNLSGMDCEYINVAEYVKQRNLTHLNIVQEPDFENGSYETKLLDTSRNISFLCDGIIKYKSKYFILELKTESTSKFMDRKGVDHKPYMQGTAYSTIFGIDEVIFVYINRDVLSMKSYLFKPSDEQRELFEGQIMTCDTYVNQNQVPPMPDNAGPKLCGYCNYKAVCKMSASVPTLI